MQDLINEYFNKLCSNKFFKNDEEVIIGKAKDVIKELEEQLEFVNSPEMSFDVDSILFMTNEVKLLINDIQDTYSNDNDVIEIALHPMSGFYVLQKKETLFEELKEYYEELEEK